MSTNMLAYKLNSCAVILSTEAQQETNPFFLSLFVEHLPAVAIGTAVDPWGAAPSVLGLGSTDSMYIYMYMRPSSNNCLFLRLTIKL